MNYSEMLDCEINAWVNECSRNGKADYCNSWAAAGPIIQAGGISIHCYKKSLPVAYPSGEGLVSDKLVKHENVLRAAMITYLMMQEVADVA